MFKIIHDLSSLTEDQKKQYLHDYSDFLGLNPSENRLDMIWLNNEIGRSLVCYVRRGTAETLRDIHGIDVTSLVKEDGPGYVSFQASGMNRKGRKEIAVGAYSTSGLTGDRLAAAVSTAQTRALRRLTLQFVGGGLLDESEVNQAVQVESTPVAAPAIQPEVKPNHEYGLLSMPKLAPDLDQYVTTAPSVVEAANAILAASQPSESAEPVKKPKRAYKRKNQVDMGDPAQPAPQPTVQPDESKPALTYVPTCPDCNGAFMAADERLDMYLCVKHGRVDTTMKPSMVKAGQPPVITPAPVVQPVPPPKTVSNLTDEQQKQVKARLAPFWVDILPKGGMTADDGLSIWAKLIKFANGYFPDFPDYKQWTFENWEMFFEFLEDFNTVNGPVKLVEYINQKIK